MRRGRDGKEKEWTDCVQSDIRAFGIAGEWKATALKTEVWVETVKEGGWRFMAALRKEEEDAARHRQEKRGNEIRQVIIAHGSVEFCEATPIGLIEESKESLYGRETDRDLRSAGGGGGVRCQTFFFFFSPLSSRPRAGLATV